MSRGSHTPRSFGSRAGRVALVCVALAGGGCDAPDPHDAPREPARKVASSMPLPVDEDLALPPGEPAAWPLQRALETDLDADGQPERLVLAADAAVNARGEVLWEDGHRWAVQVEERDAAATLLYARFLPHGRVEAAVTGAPGTPRVTILERGPYRRAAWDVVYRGPAQARVTARVGGGVPDGAAATLQAPP